MDFSLSALLIAIGYCLISLVIAGTSGSNEDKEWFANLKHPDNSFLLKIMNILGVIVYLLFGFVLYNLLVIGDITPIVLMSLIILLNGLSPYLKYKTKNLKLFFFAMLIFPILLSVLIFLLFQTNVIMAIPLIVFLLWVLYDVSYYYRLFKLNKLSPHTLKR